MQNLSAYLDIQPEKTLLAIEGNYGGNYGQLSTALQPF